MVGLYGTIQNIILPFKDMTLRDMYVVWNMLAIFLLLCIFMFYTALSVGSLCTVKVVNVCVRFSGFCYFLPYQNYHDIIYKLEFHVFFLQKKTYVIVNENVFF